MSKVPLYSERDLSRRPCSGTAFLRVHALEEQLLSRNVERCRGGLVLKAHRWLHHSTLASRVIQQKRSMRGDHVSTNERLSFSLFCILLLREGEVLACVGRIHNLKDVKDL